MTTAMKTAMTTAMTTAIAVLAATFALWLTWLIAGGPPAERRAAGHRGDLADGDGPIPPNLTFAALAAMACLAAAGATGATAQTAGIAAVDDGAWELQQSPKDPAGKPTCTLAAKRNPRVEVVRDAFVVRAPSRNGLFNYQYRIDDAPPSPPVIPTDAMRASGAIVLEGDVFDAILGGRRFQIRILDGLHEAVTEDVDLTGLRALHRRMLDACG